MDYNNNAMSNLFTPEFASMSIPNTTTDILLKAASKPPKHLVI